MKKVLVPLADGFEEMEGMIIVDVLRRAGIEVITAGLHGGEITAARRTRHRADVELKDVSGDSFDMVVLPGGAGAKILESDITLKKILLSMNEKGLPIAAICAAPNVLRNHGIIKGDDPYTQFPSTVEGGSGGNYVNERVVRSKNITTSVGPGSAFEFALDLVEQLAGEEVRKKVAEKLYLLGS